MATEVSGTWRGRLVDIRGFEGQISLRLAGEAAVKGTAEVAVGATHTSDAYRIPVSGKLSEGRMVLEGTAGGDPGVGFAIDCQVFEIPSGGLGLQGTYEVAARGFSPLRAGVIAASKGVTVPSAEVKAGGVQ